MFMRVLFPPPTFSKTAKVPPVYKNESQVSWFDSFEEAKEVPNPRKRKRLFVGLGRKK
jgi:hypothetical protein